MNDQTTQPMQALQRANAIRIPRAALKRRIRAGETMVEEVIGVGREVPEEARTMAIAELLAAQPRWRSIRTRRFLGSLRIAETRRVGDLTERQRGLIVEYLMTEPRVIDRALASAA